jgi:hypothetical protein
MVLVSMLIVVPTSVRLAAVSSSKYSRRLGTYLILKLRAPARARAKAIISIDAVTEQIASVDDDIANMHTEGRRQDDG